MLPGLFFRYVFVKGLSQALGVSALLLFLLFMAQMVSFTRALVPGQGVSLLAVPLAVLVKLPDSLPFLLPLTGLGVLLWFYWHMVHNQELVIVRSAGLTPFRIARPFLAIGLVLSLLGLVLQFWYGPRSEAWQRAFVAETGVNLLLNLIRPGQFIQLPFNPDVVFYVEALHPDRSFENLFVSGKESFFLTVASGRLQPHPDGLLLEVRGGSLEYLAPASTRESYRFEALTFLFSPTGPAGRRVPLEAGRDVSAPAPGISEIFGTPEGPLTAGVLWKRALGSDPSVPAGRRGEARTEAQKEILEKTSQAFSSLLAILGCLTGLSGSAVLSNRFRGRGTLLGPFFLAGGLGVLFSFSQFYLTRLALQDQTGLSVPIGHGVGLLCLGVWLLRRQGLSRPR